MFSLRHHAAPALATAAVCLAISSGSTAAAQPAPAHIDRGTQIVVRTTDNIDQRAADGRIYSAAVDQDVLDQSGRLAIPRGSPVELEVRGDNGDLILDLESVVVNGQRYAVRAASTRTDVPDTRSDGHSTATYVGGGAILGTIIGAIAGGGKGAAIGAATGAAAGAGAKILTRGREVAVPDDTILTFQLQRPLDVDVRDSGFERDSHHYHRYPR